MLNWCCACIIAGVDPGLSKGCKLYKGVWGHVDPEIVESLSLKHGYFQHFEKNDGSAAALYA